MKQHLTLWTMAALTSVILACSCQNNKTKLESVPEPSWYDYENYFKEKTSLFSRLPIEHDDIVMLGDEIIDFGEWYDFFQDTCMINRGIMFEGSPHTLYRIDEIAKAKPSKIFVSTGLADIKRVSEEEASAEADTVISNVKKIFERANALSPDTELYYIGILADRQVSDAGVTAIAKANKHISDWADESGLFKFIDISNLADASGRMGEQYTFDGRSLNGLGYERVAEKVLVAGLSAYARQYNRANDRKYKDISDAHHNRVSIFNSLPENTQSVMFLGNSITRRGPWQELLPVVRTTNRGVGGDVLKGMYNRLDDVIAANPIAIFIMGGINDLTKPESNVDAVWKDYENLLAKLKKELPETRLYIQSTLPVTAEFDKDTVINAKVAELNKYLKAAEVKYEYRFVDVAARLSDEEGNLRPEFTLDGLHLMPAAYFEWCTEIIEQTPVFLLMQLQHALDYQNLQEQIEQTENLQ